MNDQDSEAPLSLYQAARNMGVKFTKENSPTDKYIDVNNLKIHYLEWGDIQNPTIILVHGIAQTCHSWDFIALGLSEKYRVIALDLRGHGDSDWSSDNNYTLEAYSDDLHTIIEKLNITNFIIIGLSVGGKTSFTYASKHTDKIRALIIVDAAPENMQAGYKNMSKFMKQKDELDSIDEFIDRILKYNPRRTRQQARGSIIHNIKQLKNGKWTWKYDSFFRSPQRVVQNPDQTAKTLWNRLENVTCPALIVRGAQSDLVAGEITEKMALRMNNATLVTVENAGHLGPGDNPEGFQIAINNFLNQL